VANLFDGARTGLLGSSEAPRAHEASYNEASYNEASCNGAVSSTGTGTDRIADISYDACMRSSAAGRLEELPRFPLWTHRR
jgi:hypothetical protein